MRGLRRVGRRNRRKPEEPRRRSAGPAPERSEEWDGRSWRVRTVSGSAAADKVYRCPGCDQELPSGQPHVVAWPEDGYGGLAGPQDRRHWHSVCWAARAHRGPRARRGGRL